MINDSNWQINNKLRSFFNFTIHFNLSLMLFNDPLRDGETKAGAGCLFAEKWF